MEKLINVTLINGKTIPILPRELPGLIAAGKVKEHKPEPEEITKDNPVPKETKITTKNIKGGRPKKA